MQEHVISLKVGSKGKDRARARRDTAREENGSIVVLGQTYAGGTLNRGKETELEFQGGTCVICSTLTAKDDPGVLRHPPEPDRPGAVGCEDCVIAAFVGRKGETLRAKAFSFLGRLPLADRHPVVRRCIAIVRRSRRTH